MGRAGADWVMVGALGTLVSALVALLTFLRLPAVDDEVPGAPGTSSATPSSEPTAGPDQVPTATGPPPSDPSVASSVATYDVNERSYYSDDYYAWVRSVELDRATGLLTLQFEAFGEPDLRSPRTSCLDVPGYRDVPVRDMRLDVDGPGHYAGHLTFTLTDPGEYRFIYSCQNDYTAVRLLEFDPERLHAALGQQASAAVLS